MLFQTTPVRAYLALTSIQSLAFALAFTLQGLYFIQVAHLTPLQLLLVGAVLEGAVLLLEVPTAVVADRFSRRLSVILGCLCLGVAMLLVGAVPVFWALLLAQLVAAAGYTFLSGAEQAWLADEVGEAPAARLFLSGSQYGRMAGILGVLGALALSRWGLQWPVLAGGLLMLALSAALALCMPERGFAPDPHAGEGQWRAMASTLRSGVREVRASRVLTVLIGVAMLHGASSEAIDRLREYQLIVTTGLPGGLSGPTVFVLLSLAGLVTGMIVTEPLRRRLDPSDARQLRRTLRTLSLLMLLCLLAFALAPGFWWAASALLALGVLRGLYGPLYSGWLNQGLASGTRATVNSLAGQADALGQVSFGPLFGLLGNLAGVRTALGLAALIQLPVLWLLRRPAPDPAPDAPASAP
ncbi:MFS transporter [Deinococcus sonorensis]|uniref:MFS transporter n=2 Tax=Deinococcus sonorensis TaxID=309891 RepID=A0AAU7U7U8_9DEIO